MKAYPPEVHEFVKEWAPKMRDSELAAKCNAELGTNFTVHGMKSFRGNHGYRCGKRELDLDEYWKWQTDYPKGMYEFIRDNSRGVNASDMAKMTNEKFGTNWTEGGMSQFRRRHRIKSGLTGQFEKGCVPQNKGKTLEEICKHDPEKIARVKSTQFSKGHVPANRLPVGAIVMNSFGYLLRKKSSEGAQWDRWEFLHRTVWEEHNGPIPDGMYVAFKDGNKTNCDIDNLMLITRAENAQLTQLGFRSEDPELTGTGLNVIRLANAVKEKRKAKGAVVAQGRNASKNPSERVVSEKMASRHNSSSSK